MADEEITKEELLERLNTVLPPDTLSLLEKFIKTTAGSGGGLGDYVPMGGMNVLDGEHMSEAFVVSNYNVFGSTPAPDSNIAFIVSRDTGGLLYMQNNNQGGAIEGGQFAASSTGFGVNYSSSTPDVNNSSIGFGVYAGSGINMSGTLYDTQIQNGGSWGITASVINDGQDPYGNITLSSDNVSLIISKDFRFSGIQPIGSESSTDLVIDIDGALRTKISAVERPGYIFAAGSGNHKITSELADYININAEVGGNPYLLSPINKTREKTFQIFASVDNMRLSPDPLPFEGFDGDISFNVQKKDGTFEQYLENESFTLIKGTIYGVTKFSKNLMLIEY